jgi:hypothetical protein
MKNLELIAGGLFFLVGATQMASIWLQMFQGKMQQLEGGIFFQKGVFKLLKLILGAAFTSVGGVLFYLGVIS